MIDVLNENLVDLRDACGEKALRNARTKKPAHISQAYRWTQIGARAVNGARIKLEIIKTPSGLRTSREAIARFIAALTNPEAPLPAPRSRAKQITQAENELKEAGFEFGGPE